MNYKLHQCKDKHIDYYHIRSTPIFALQSYCWVILLYCIYTIHILTTVHKSPALDILLYKVFPDCLTMFDPFFDISGHTVQMSLPWHLWSLHLRPSIFVYFGGVEEGGTKQIPLPGKTWFLRYHLNIFESWNTTLASSACFANNDNFRNHRDRSQISSTVQCSYL